MKDEKMNIEALSRAELLTLLSILEGELEAQDVVIHALRAQQRDAFIQGRYGQYDLSDPFLALQRDSESEERQNMLSCSPVHPQGRAVGPNPLAVLKLVMAHCKRMQERMMGQLAAAENRHTKMIAELEQEKRRSAQVSAHCDDFTSLLETERDKLLQQLETERAAFERLEKEQAQTVNEVEESLSQQQQLSSTLTLELQKASSLAQEEAQKASQLCTLLQEETSAFERLQGLLEDEKRRVAELEASCERQLAEFDTEREQMQAQLCKEEGRNRELERQLEELRKALADPGRCKEVKEPESKVKESLPKLKTVSTSVQTELDGKTVASKSTSVSKVNGCKSHKETDVTHEDRVAENGVLVDNGGGALLQSPPHLQSSSLCHPQSPSSTASSSLSSSPISSPILSKRLGSPGFHQSAYQAGVNQRFQAARHKFQSQAELEQLQQHGGPLSPRDLSPTTSSVPPPPEHSAAKQLARNTVTQVLSRFTSQQAGVKLAPISNSPFGTDYRTVAVSPTGGRSPSAGPLSPSFRSPLAPRSERTHPPPIPPKKPGVSPPPGSPSHSSRISAFPELTGNCGHSGQEGAKEPDLLVSSSS